MLTLCILWCWFAVSIFQAGFSLPAAEFQTEFGFDKPTAKDVTVLYCKGGVRSVKAQNMLLAAGYLNVYSYKGAYTEWSSHHPTA